MMMTMPVDVFCEIAHHLEPDDLLRMSRTTKALRELLLSKGSKPIWRAAEEAVGLPECPTDLSSPQYASFVFDTFCMHCFDARAHFDMHAITLRVRLCKTCKKSSLVCDKDYFHFAVTIQESASLKELNVLSLLLTGSEYKKKINNLTSAKPRPAMRYKPHLQAVLEKYMSYDRDSDEQKRYHICQLDSWLEDLNETKAQEITMQEEFVKLKELGYVYEDLRDNLDEKGWKWDKLIEQPRALTDRIWDNIRPELEKTIHLRREKKARLCSSRE
ncbi:hypothetical protein DFH11DRAFT_1573137 [Phellopilus nigrolimitatus]|nr:hypothetical protein DFH11DRAFT_1573137 [Phellopilus nigrolimitatus]